MKILLLIAALLSPAGAVQAPSGTVSGELRTREGQPAVGVRVSAMALPEAGATASSGTALVSIGTTDSQGRYRLENVIPGRYYITAGFVELPTFYPGVSAMSGATAVQVLSGTPVTGINFSVANPLGVTVSGRVRRSTGTAGVGGQPVALIGGTAQPQQAMASADGSFQFLRVLPGTYQLNSALGRAAQPVSILVGDQDIAGLEIVVIPTVSVSGTVVIEGNGIRPRVQLQLSTFKGSGQNAGMSSQPDGSLRAVIPEGDYRVSWSNLPVGYEIKAVTSGNIDLLTSSLKVYADTPPEPIRVVIAIDGNPWVKVSGRAANLGSTRTFILTGPNVDQIQLTLNPDGTFEIPQALPGQYMVRPNPNPALTATSLSLATQAITIVIPNQDTTNLIIPLPLTKVVQGIVVNNSGAAVQGRFSLSYSQTTASGSSSGSRSMLIPPDGKFSLELSPGGDAHISVSAPGYSIKSLTYGTADLMRENLKVAMTDTAELRVVLDTASATIGVVGGAVGTQVGVVSGGIVGGITSIAAPPPPPPPPLTPPSPSAAASAANVNRVSSELAQANLVSRVAPVYPALANAARVQGSVVLQLEISTVGRVQNVSVISGNPLLNDAAIAAVRQWTYNPFVLNGRAIPVITTATVNFTLP